MLTDDLRRLARETMDDVPRWNDDADHTVGVASEAASLLLRTTDEHLPDQVVLVVTQTANAPSLTLAVCLGFQNVGTFVEFDAEQWLGAGQLHELARVSPRRLSLEDVGFQCPLP